MRGQYTRLRSNRVSICVCFELLGRLCVSVLNRCERHVWLATAPGAVSPHGNQDPTLGQSHYWDQSSDHRDSNQTHQMLSCHKFTWASTLHLPILNVHQSTLKYLAKCIMICFFECAYPLCLFCLYGLPSK